MRRRFEPATRPPRVALVGIGLTLLVVAWIVATVPFAAPDEASHYQRALSITNGRILGPKVAYTLLLPPAQQTFINHDTRAVLVPARLSPPDVRCINGQPDLRGSCLEADPNGNFPPLPYLLPAVALAVSHDASTGLWLSRAASAIPSLAFLLLALALLWAGSGWSLLGFFAASSPTVLFVASILNSSGLQISACLAFAAAGLRVARAPAAVPQWVWVSFALAGTVAILAGPIGLEFALADLVLAGALLPRRAWRELAASGGRAPRLAALVLLTAAALALIYSHLAGFSAHFGITPIGLSLQGGLDQLPRLLSEVVGVFGSESVQLPTVVFWIWWLPVVALLAAALWLGNLRQRLVVGAVTVLSLAFPVLFWAWVDRFSGFDLQGREVLPILGLIPLVAGEVVFQRGASVTGRPTARLVLGATVGVIALVQGYAWWYSAGAAAGSPGTLLFSVPGGWSPPLGWLPWAALAALGTVALLSFAAAEALNRRGARPLSGGSV